jgi:hypothetical protein
MRTAIIILVGLLLWATCLGLAKWLGAANSSSMSLATLSFIVVWFIAAAANLWVGVAHAGYSLREELPIFLLIFLLPALVAGIVKWRFL